jgi:hypothetical protein
MFQGYRIHNKADQADSTSSKQVHDRNFQADRLLDRLTIQQMRHFGKYKEYKYHFQELGYSNHLNMVYKSWLQHNCTSLLHKEYTIKSSTILYWDCKSQHCKTNKIRYMTDLRDCMFLPDKICMLQS